MENWLEFGEKLITNWAKIGQLSDNSSFFSQMLAGVLERCMKRRGVRDCDPYDWEKTGGEVAQAVTTSSSTTAFPTKPQQRIINNPATSVTTENLCEDPLAASLALNNQENRHPGNLT